MWGGNDPQDNLLRNILNDPSSVDDMIDEFIDDHGFNGFHFYSLARGWFNIDQYGNALSSSESNPDPETFEALEEVIVKTYRAGGHVHLWYWGDQQRGQTPLNYSSNVGGGLQRHQ